MTFVREPDPFPPEGVLETTRREACGREPHPPRPDVRALARVGPTPRDRLTYCISEGAVALALSAFVVFVAPIRCLEVSPEGVDSGACHELRSRALLPSELT